MTYSANKELVKKINLAFSNGDPQFIFTYLSPRIKWNIVGMPTIRGKNNFVKTFESLGLWKVVQIADEKDLASHGFSSIIAEKNYVVVEYNRFDILNSAGSTIKTAHCDIYRLKKGIIQELTSYIVDTTSEADARVISFPL